MQNIPIIREIAEVIGFLFRGIYLGLSSVNIHSVAFCIIIFTVILKLFSIKHTCQNVKMTVVTPKLSQIGSKEVARFSNKLEHPLGQAKCNIEKEYFMSKYGLNYSLNTLTLLLRLPIVIAIFEIVENAEVYIPELLKLSATNFRTVFSLFGMDVHNKIGFTFSPMLILPVLVIVSQYLESYILTSSKNVVNGENKGKRAATIVNIVMAVISFVIIVKIPIACNLYLLISSFVNVLFNLIFKLYFSHKDADSFRIQQRKQENKNRIKRDLQPLSMLSR